MAATRLTRLRCCCHLGILFSCVCQYDPIPTKAPTDIREIRVNLIDAMQSEYSRSKRLLYCAALPLTLALFIAAIVGALPIDECAVNVIAIATFIVQFALFVLRQYASDYQEHAEAIRRMAMLQDGLGVQPAPIAVARLHATVGELPNHQRTFLGSYYESSLPIGPRRLIEITTECAFFTGHNARWLWRTLALIAGGGLFVAIAAFVAIVLFYDSTTAPKLAAKIVIPAMAFCAAGDLAGMAFLFRSLAESCDDELRDAEHNLEQSQDLQADQQAALAIFSAYNCAVVKAPPIPTWVHRRRQNLLNRAWRSRQESLTAPSPASQ